MPSVFPAVRGRQGDTDYVVTQMRLAELNRWVRYAEDVQDWEVTPPELRAQRKLNLPRVRNEMVPYLIDNQDHFFGAITVELLSFGESSGLPFKEVEEGTGLGQLVLDGTETLMCLDGQHRLKTVELALQKEPLLGQESIAVIVVPYRNIPRSQQLFSDLNRYAKSPTKTLNILYSHRDFFARLAKGVADRSTYFRGRVNMESNTLGQNNPQVITLGVLYECVSALNGNHGEDIRKEEESDEQFQEILSNIVHVYDDVIFPALAKSAPEVELVAVRKAHPHDLRKKYIFAHSVGQQAIARAVRAAIDQRRDNWEDIVADGFSQIDWEIGLKWEGVATMAGTLANRRQNIDRTASLIKVWLGLETTDAERADLMSAKQAGGDASWSLPSPVTTTAVKSA